MNPLKKLSDKHSKALYCFRLYCTKCNSILLESDPFTRKDLISNWDTIVLTSPVVPCKTCKHSVPNFYITLKIVSLRTGREYLPKDFIPNPKEEYSSIIESIVNKAQAEAQSGVNKAKSEALAGSQSKAQAEAQSQVKSQAEAQSQSGTDSTSQSEC